MAKRRTTGGTPRNPPTTTGGTPKPSHTPAWYARRQQRREAKRKQLAQAGFTPSQINAIRDRGAPVVEAAARRGPPQIDVRPTRPSRTMSRDEMWAKWSRKPSSFPAHIEDAAMKYNTDNDLDPYDSFGFHVMYRRYVYGDQESDVIEHAEHGS